MIKVLIVDDDKLVRKGLISVMPWSDFDMEVVGEAQNGEKALEFLETNSVDLMLTDLAMPVMSGMELMREARKRYPRLFMVILTLHQDFNYIQEALRLGALDYIAKVQLEKERLEEVLGRIHGRIEEEGFRHLPNSGSELAVNHDVDTAYVFLSKEGNPNLSWLSDRFQNDELEEVDLNVWLWKPQAQLEPDSKPYLKLAEAMSEHYGWNCMKLSGLTGEKMNSIHRTLRSYRHMGFFYDYCAEKTFYERTIAQLQEENSVIAEDRFLLLKEKWLSFEWVQKEQIFLNWLSELKSLRMPPARVVHLLLVLETEWNRVYASLTGDKLQSQYYIQSWHDASIRLQMIRDQTVQSVVKPQYSPEVTDCIMRAVKIIQEEIDRSVHAVEVARRVNMSRSYFSQCFKDLTGKPFNEYLRYARYEKAKEYLLHSTKTIQWIAEHTGYSDEKYFSRVFRSHSGMLPSEFRQQQRQGRNV